MIRKLTIVFLSLLPSISFASDFDEVLDTVMSNNLSLRYAAADNAATVEELKVENVLEAPEVSFENLWGAKGIGDKRNFSISQSFDWPGVYAARRDAVRKSETAMQYLRESAVLDTRMEIRLLLIDIINLKQRIATSKKICDILADMVTYYEKAVEQGNETRLDYNKAVIEHINAVRELKTANADYSVLLASLQTLNGGKDVTTLVEKLGYDYPSPNLDALRPNRETLLAKDPAIAASRASLEAQKSLVKVEKRSLLPGFSVSYLHEWEMGDNFNGFSVSVNLPFLTQRRKAKAAKMRLDAQSMELEMNLIKLAAELEADYQTALDLRELLNSYRGVMSDNSNFELLKKAFDAGQISFLTYMQELDFFLVARRDLLEAHYRFHRAAASLQRYD